MLLRKLVLVLSMTLRLRRYWWLSKLILRNWNSCLFRLKLNILCLMGSSIWGFWLRLRILLRMKEMFMRKLILMLLNIINRSWIRNGLGRGIISRFINSRLSLVIFWIIICRIIIIKCLSSNSNWMLLLRKKKKLNKLTIKRLRFNRKKRDRKNKIIHSSNLNNYNNNSNNKKIYSLYPLLLHLYFNNNSNNSPSNMFLNNSS